MLSCQKDYEAPNDLADFAWYTSSDRDNTDPIMISTAQYLSIMDASQGSTRRTWTIPYNNGARFLKNEMISSTDKDYTDNIDTSRTYTSDETTVHIYFPDHGDHIVNLTNVFEKPVTFTYSYRSGGNRYYATMETEYINGEYVMSYDFNVAVLNSTIEPLSEVYLLDSAGNVVEQIETGYDPEDEYSFVDIFLTYGQTLRFVDVTGDYTNEWTWECEDANVAESASFQTYDISFYKLAQDVPFNVTHNVSRVEDSTYPSLIQSGPTSVLVNLDIYVDLSEDPLSATALHYDDDYTITYRLENTMFDFENNNAFTYSADNGEYTLNSSLLSLFSLAVENDSASFSGTFNPSSAVVTEGVENALVLTFDDALYNTDEMVLTYNGGDNDIMVLGESLYAAMDGIYSIDVTSNLITTNGENSVVDTSYFDFTSMTDAELAGRTPADFGWYFRNTSNEVYTENTVEFVDDPAGGGYKVLKLTIPSSTSSASGLVNDYLFDAAAGNYFYEYEIYCDTTPTTSAGLTAYITTSSSVNNQNFTSNSEAGTTNGGGYFTPSVNSTWTSYYRAATSGYGSSNIPRSAGGTDLRICLYLNSYKGGEFYIRKVILNNAYDRE